MHYREIESPRGDSYTYVSNQDFHWDSNVDSLDKVSAICRLNALTMIQFAGSGHIGSSFSVIDLMLATKFHIQKNSKIDKTFFFSSKGHDAPGLYAVEHALKNLSDESLFKLRRLDGLPGHPEIGIAGVPTNTGSLGMGISKGKGFIYASRLINDSDPNVFVFLGDGELQEGQIWESMSTANRDALKTLTVIVDANLIQSDTWIEKTNPLGDLKKRVESYGWNYVQCEGHNFQDLIRAVEFDRDNKPLFICADTIKGSGVERFENFDKDGNFYKYHSGAIKHSEYLEVVEELKRLIENPHLKRKSNKLLEKNNSIKDSQPKIRPNNLIEIWANQISNLANIDNTVMALDADLSYDTGTYLVKKNNPSQYLQFGIAEQDMVSTAGTIALGGAVPFVHSFASFLTTRSFEQIFNNSTEDSRIIYLGFLAGLLPSAPGHSHQAVMDLSLMGSIPNMNILEPACSIELESCLSDALEHAGPSYIRISSFDICPDLEKLTINGLLHQRRKGNQVLLISSGSTGVNLALETAEILENKLEVEVASRFDLKKKFLQSDISYIKKFKKIFVIENHLPFFGIYEELVHLRALRKLDDLEIFRIGLNEIPKNGQPDEILRYHNMHPEQIARTIETNV